MFFFAKKNGESYNNYGGELYVEDVKYSDGHDEGVVFGVTSNYGGEVYVEDAKRIVK